MARTLDRPQEQTLSTVKVAPTHSPPANVTRKEPFIKPTDQPSQHTDLLHLTSLVPTLQFLNLARPVALFQTDPCLQTGQKLQIRLLHQIFRKHLPVLLIHPEGNYLTVIPTLTVFCRTGHLWIYIYVVEGELSDEQDATITDPDQSLSEEQSYRETMRGIRSFMGWTHISQTLTLVLQSQRTILLPIINFNNQEKCRYNSLQTNGSARSSASLM